MKKVQGHLPYKITTRILGGLITLLVLLVAAGRIWITTAPAQIFMTRQINTRIPGTLTWKAINLSLFRGEVALKSVALHGPEGEPLITLERASVNLSWGALLRGNIRAEELILYTPSVWLKTTQDGTPDIVAAFVEPGTTNPDDSEPSGPLPFNLIIERLELTQGRLQYELTAPPHPMRLTLDRIDLTLLHADLKKEAGEASLRLGKGSIAGQALNRTRVEVLLKKGRLSLKSLTVETPKGQASATGELDLREAFPQGLLGEIQDPEALSYTLDLTQTGTPLNQIPGMPPGFTGTLQSHLTLMGRGIAPETLTAKGELSVSAKGIAPAGDHGAVELFASLDATMGKNRISVQHLTVESGAARVDAKGSLNLGSKELGAQVTLGVPELDKLKLPLAFPHLKGSLSGHFGVTGLLTAPVVEAQLQGDGLQVDALTLGAIRLNTRLGESGTLTLTTASLENDGSRIDARGTIQLLERELSPTLPTELSMTLSHIKVAPFIKGTGISGSLDGTATLQGPLLFPEATLAFKTTEIAVGNQPVGAVSGEIRLTRGELLLKSLGIRNGASHLALSGNARLLHADTRTMVSAPSFDLTLGGEGLFLDDFSKELKGHLTINGQFTGEATHPIGTLNIKGQSLTLWGQPVHGINLASRMDGERVTVENLSLTLAPRETITVRGWALPFGDQFSLEVNAKALSLDQLDAMDGSLSLALTAGGAFLNPQLQGEANLSRVHLYNEPFGDGRFSISLRDHLLQISGNLLGKVQGLYNLTTQDFQVNATLRKLQLAPFFKIAGQQDLTGELSGQVKAHGNAASPEKIEAQVQIPRIAISQKKQTILQASNLNASYTGGTLVLPDLRFTLFDKAVLEISGRGERKGQLDFKAKGALPMEVLTLFIEDLGGTTGEVRVSASAQGTFDRPELQGVITLNQIGLTVPGLEETLHSINGRVLITPKAITLERLTGKLGLGTFQGTGTLTMDQWAPVSINTKLSTKNLPITIPNTMDALVSSTLTLNGSPQKAQIAGEIEILEGEYTKPFKLGLIDNVGRKTRAVAPLQKTETPSYLANTTLQIAIRHRNAFVIDNNLTLMALKPTLQIYGPISAPLISGRAEVESGMVTYLGKEFEIKKGVVDFINPYKIEPTLDLMSAVKVREWTLYLEVSGVLENLHFEMSSDPAETDKDILSLITFGKTTTELINREGGTSQSTKQVLADFMTKGLQDQLKEATGLDTVELKYTESTDNEYSDDVNITIGKELSKRITLKYGVGTKNGDPIQSAITEYKFYENVLMNAFQDTEGDFGGELIFRLEFR